jgi:hypothetical protein
MGVVTVEEVFVLADTHILQITEDLRLLIPVAVSHVMEAVDGVVLHKVPSVLLGLTHRHNPQADLHHRK